MVKVIKKLKTKVMYIITICFLALPFTTQAYSVNELKCLVDSAYHESRGEGKQGQLAVIFTVLNRTKDKRFPNTPCKVISAPHQFSWYGKGKVVKEKELHKEIEVLVKEVVAGKHKDVTNGAVFFHTRGINPSWSRKLTCTTTIGGHKFFK